MKRTLVKGRRIRPVHPRILQHDRGRPVLDNRREVAAREEWLGKRELEHELEPVVDIDASVGWTGQHGYVEGGEGGGKRTGSRSSILTRRYGMPRRSLSFVVSTTRMSSRRH